jgi:hypothetical protein
MRCISGRQNSRCRATGLCDRFRHPAHADVLRRAALITVTSEAVDVGRADDGGAGIIIVATTAEGCLLCGSALLGRGDEAGAVGASAAAELLGNLGASRYVHLCVGCLCKRCCVVV